MICRSYLELMENAKITAGIDSGALSTDAVVLVAGEIKGYSILPTGPSASASASAALLEACHKAGIKSEKIEGLIATGYGRGEVVGADRTVTEITCHAVGARHIYPQAATIIDIGGQDCKVIRLSSDGRVEDFIMNDKCAAGTGRFLEVMAQALHVSLDELAEMATKAEKSVRISSTCTVFAESEVVGLVGQGVAPKEIAFGLFEAVAERVLGMVARIRAQKPFVFTGGVAKNSGVVAALERKLKSEILLPQEPQIIGALGAAILAAKQDDLWIVR